MAVALHRGEVWVARLNPNQGGEFGKTRPVVILQADALTQAGLPTILVAPLSTQVRRETAPLRVLLPARDRLLRDSVVCVEQVRALDRNRLGEGPLTVLHEEEMAATERALRGVLGFV